MRFYPTGLLLSICIIVALSVTSISLFSRVNPQNEKAVNHHDHLTETLINYDQPTQTGVDARREYRNGAGQLVKEIYYYRSFRQPVKMSIHSIVKYKYDQKGREIREDHYLANMKLDRSLITKYATDGDKDRQTWIDASGVRTYEMRYDGIKCVSHLYFDESGNKLIGIHLAVPKDIKLAYCYGKPANGLCLGIAPFTERAPLGKMQIYASVLNIGASDVKLVTGFMYDEIKMELRQVDKSLVLPDVAFINIKKKKLQTMNPNHTESIQTIYSGEAFNQYSYELKDWYPKLEPGIYSVIISRRASGSDYPLVSNRIKITVT